ncbi:MAG: hypothetical protein RL885_31435 [Planctomycetota bacterium]
MLTCLAVLCLGFPPCSGADEGDLVSFVKLSYESALASRYDDLERWREQWQAIDAESRNAIELLGYREPTFLVRIADLGAWLFERTGEREYAETVAEILAGYGEHRAAFPAELLGLSTLPPAVSWFRQLPAYARAYRRTRAVEGVYSPEEKETIEGHIAESVDAIFDFPEWGAHNRAMLRAWSLLEAAETLPEHPRAKRWRRLADILASDSLGQWEIEDAQVYHALWLEATIHVIDLLDRHRAWSSPMLRYYFDYLVCLLAPNRTIPPFGDGWWASQMPLYWAVLERGAMQYRSPEMKWAASQIRATQHWSLDEPSPGLAQLWIGAQGWIDETLESRPPAYGSGLCLEDLYGKKVVFRDGWAPEDAFLLYSYRDEGEHGRLHKDYLRRVLAVEEEKMTHGQSDEQSIVLWMEEGSVLLVDAGYRERSPSGEYGAFRADLFHNRVVLRRGKRSPGQPLLEMLRSSGAYDETVRTEGLDFQTSKQIEYARSRWTSDRLPARWDRALVKHREGGWLLVVDAVELLEDGYFTLASLLHGQHIVASGDDWAVLRYETIGDAELPAQCDLLVLFPEAGEQEIGQFDLRRNRQPERTFHASTSRWYDRGSRETFVTVLQPIPRGEDPAPYLERFRRVDGAGLGVGIEWRGETCRDFIGVKHDLDHGLLNEEVRPRYTAASGAIRYALSPEVSTDADLVFCRDLDADDPEWLAVNMTHVDLGERRVFEASEVPFFQTWGRSDRTGRAKWRRWSSDDE